MATEYPAFLVDLKEFIAGALKGRVALHHDEIEVISRDVVELWVDARNGANTPLRNF